MFSKVKKVFGGIVAIFVVLFVIDACFGESDEGSETSGEGGPLIRECSNLEQCLAFNSSRGTGNHYNIAERIERNCKAGDKIACRAIELTNEIETKCKEGDTQLCVQASKYLEWERLGIIACERNNKQGCYEARRYERGCELNHADSCFKAAEEERGISEKRKKIPQLYSKACDLKSAAACNNLGIVYETGKKWDRTYVGSEFINYPAAKSSYDKACKLGSEVGCENAKRIAKERGL